MIRNRRKIDAIVQNANGMIELEQQHGSFQKYLRSHESFDALVRDLRKHFKFLGDMGCYYFLYVVGEQVPPYEKWHAAHSGQR
ncbi:MAG: DNA-3-methyladenine glycosylase I [Dehalococcoidia bacterium]